MKIKKSILIWIAVMGFTALLHAQTSQQVTAIQYYYDTDPGVGNLGNGAVVAVTPSATLDQVFSFNVPATLANGFHYLYVRAQDENGAWSLTERRMFVIQSITATENITDYAYYFDTDPGVGNPGNGAIVPVTSTPDFTSTVAITVPPSLSEGFHYLYVRARDTSGEWSLTERRLFVIQSITPTENITDYAYYFDTDPGVGNPGNGAIVPVSSVANFSSTVAITVPPSLTEGFHYLYVRARDVSGQWSITERRLFVIQSITATENITDYAYYFDTDPGVGNPGNGAIVPVTPTANFSATVAITIPSTLPEGVHYLYVRTKDESGQWSISERRMFVNQTFTLSEDVTELEWYLDNDPGIGNANSYPITTTGEFNATIDLGGLPCDISLGTHHLYVRAKDTSGRWSLIERLTLNIVKSEISISGNTIIIADGDASADTADGTDFGQTFSFVPVTQTFTIDNNGSGPLNISSLSMSGANPSNFTISDISAPLSIPVGGSTNFTVSFEDPTIGIYNAILSINSDDCDLEVYDFALQGEVICQPVEFTACPGNIQVNNTTGQCNAEVTYVATLIGDPPTVSYIFTGATSSSGTGTGSGSTFNVGVTNVIINAFNDCGDVNCAFTVTVTDNELPIINDTPANIIAANDFGNCDALVTWSAATVSDNCPGATISSDYNSGDIFPVGTTTVTYIASDAAGNNAVSTSFTVTVNDTEAPGGGSQFAPPAIALNNIPEAANYNLVYELNIPNNTNWDANSQITYAVNNAAALTNIPFTRVAYMMELDGKWVWVSFDQITQNYNQIGIPVDYVKQQAVSNMNVFASSNAGVTTGTDIQTGNVEFWSNCYGQAAGNPSIPQGNNGLYDFNDYTTSTDCYGSFQVHNYGIAETLFAFNSWSFGNPNEAGIGNQVGGSGHPDWTFAYNAATYATKKIYVLALSSSVVCNDVTLTLDANGQATLNLAQVNSGASDNCGVATNVLSKTDFDCSNVGENTVTLTITDIHGNSSICTSTVTVEDNEIPVINDTPANIVVSNDSGNCDAVVNWTLATVTDNCPGAIISSNYNSGDTFPLGTTTVTYTASDANGNDAVATSFTVTVTDDEDPTITCAAAVSINNTSGACYGEVVLTPPTVTDNCEDNALDFDGVNDFVSVPHNSGLTIGSNSLSVEFWFKAPNVNRVGIIVAKREPSPPYNQLSIYTGDGTNIFNPQPGKKLTFALYSAGSSYRIITTTNDIIDGGEHHFAAVSDPVSGVLKIFIDGILQQVSTYSEGTFPSITNTEPYTLGFPNANLWYYEGELDEVRIWNTARTQAEIQANMNTELNTTPGLVASYHFNEGVADANNAGITTALDASGYGNDGTLNNFALTGDTSNWVGQSTVEATWNGNPVTDNTQFDLGPNTVTWTATDAAGNTATCQQIVTVTDDEIPVINGTPANITQSNDSGNCDAIVNWTPATVSDNCPGATISSDYTSGDTFPLGTTTVTYTASDANGNDAVATSFTVTVTDDEDPTITCAAAQSQTANAGQCDADVIVTPPSFTDNCTTATITNDFNGTADASGTYPLGDTTVTWTVNDGNGQTAQCTQIITVTDDEIPVINGTPANITQSNDSGVCDAKVFWTPATVSDNCPGATISSDYNSGDTFPLGTTTVTYTASDANGNDAVATSFTVTVTDDEDPTITCAAAQSQTADAGQCDAAVIVTPPSFTDNCTTATITNDFNGTDDASGTYPLGATTVTWTVNDGNGQTAQCTQIITVTDDEIPVINGTPANITVSNDPGSCDAIVNWTLATVSDNCPGATISSDYNPGDTFPLGTTTVNYTAVDAAGNNAVATSFTVTVTDDEIPVINGTPGNITVSNDPGSCDAIVNWTLATVSDNCPGATISSDSNSGDTFPLGTTTVNYTAVDAAGNNAVATSFTVTVTDDEDPIAICPADITVSNDPGDCSAVVSFSASFTDNCTGGSVVASPASGSTFDVGTTEVTVTATDAAGNTDVCTFNVTVVDDEAPIVDCVNLSITLDDQGNGIIDPVAFSAANGSTDNCGIESIVLSETAFSCADIGGDLDELIISEYVDGTGTNDWIEIYNGTGSTIVLGDVVNGAFVSNYSIKIYTDGSTTPVTIGLLGSIADRQTFKIAHTDATTNTDEDDISYNFGSPLMVFDGNDAIALANDDVAVDIIGVIGDNPGSGWTSASNSTNGTTLIRNLNIQQGNVSSFVANLESEWTQFAQNDVSNLGDHEIEISNNANNVILTVTDIHGNVATCEGSVTVVDAILPEAICQNVTVQLDADGNGSTTAQAVDNGSNDACGIASLALSQTQFTCADVGTNTVTLTVTDSNGNVSTCTATVTVEDNVNPDVITQDITVQLDNTGNASIIPNDVDDGSSDACGIVNTTVSPSTFTCADVGPNTVTLTITDTYGNVDSETAIVTVQDNVAPVAQCNDITVNLDANGDYALTTQDIDAIGLGSSDACGIASLSVLPNTFTCNEVGANTVTLTVTDVNGNSSTCDATVTVEGIIPTVSINAPEELPEFCQGAVLVLTTTATNAVSYLWAPGGETTESIEVGPEGGTFTVTVTSATNCSVSDTFTVAAFDASTLLSAYTILAEEEVFLHGSNLVQSGGIGATDTNGLIKLHQATNVIEFGRAANIVLNQGSTIVNPIFQPANIPFPAFVTNTLSNNTSPDVTANTDITLSGSVYDKITVQQGVTVTFSQSDIYIDELKTFDGAAIEFSGCANVYINEKFMLAQNGTINANGNNVVMYVNEDVQIEKGSYVRARIHSNGNELLAKGPNGNANNSGDLTQMIGLFIAKKVHGNKNVVWNADNLCNPCSISSQSPPSFNGSFNSSFDVFDVESWPNPSETVFNLRLKTLDLNTESKIQVFDISNKLVHTGKFNPQDIYKFGNELESGLYIVKIDQGHNSKTIRLVKY